MSKLVKRLHQISENSNPPMGFRASTAKPSRQMALVASVSSGGMAVITRMDLTDLDGVMLNAEDAADDGSLKRIAGELRDTPWGVWIREAKTNWLKEFKSVGGDFVAFDSPDAPAVLLQEEGIGKVLKAEPSLERGLLSTISDLPLDAVILEVKKGKDLAISDLMACRWLGNLTDKPFLVVPHGELSEAEIRSLWEVGVIGIVIEVVGQQSQEVLARQSQAIRGLPARPRRRKEGTALLSHLAPGPGDIDGD